MTQERGRAGVVCSHVEVEDGSVRIILDDVERVQEGTLIVWRHKAFFTRKAYSAGAAELEALSDAELAEFGFNILARLPYSVWQGMLYCPPRGGMGGGALLSCVPSSAQAFSQSAFRTHI